MHANPWILAPSLPRPEAPHRLFCFPYAGGGASTFASWAACLPAGVEVFPVQLPGRENRLREPLFRELPPLVEALATALTPLLNRPFAFFGHSLGALIAFELTRWLRRHSGPLPMLLMLSAQAPPHLPRNYPSPYALSDDSFLQELARRYGGIPSQLFSDRELRELFLPVLQADFALLAAYRYQAEAPLEMSLEVFGGEQDRAVRHDELYAWQEHTRGPIRLRLYPGDHFYVKPSRDALMADIARALDSV
jgi:surfactin synthase thioesterase subunit